MRGFYLPCDGSVRTIFVNDHDLHPERIVAFTADGVPDESIPYLIVNVVYWTKNGIIELDVLHYSYGEADEEVAITVNHGKRFFVANDDATVILNDYPEFTIAAFVKEVEDFIGIFLADWQEPEEAMAHSLTG